MKLVLNSAASSIGITVAVAIVSSFSICVTGQLSLDNLGGIVDGILNGNSTNITSIIDTILANNTFLDSVKDTDTVLDGLFNETNTTDAWNVMKEYLTENKIELAPDGYFEDLLSDPMNATNYLEGTGIANGTIDWNATYIITDLFNRTNLTSVWENVKSNITNMNISMPNMSMPSSMDGGSMAPAASPTMDMPTMDKPTMDSMKTNAPVMKPTMDNVKTNAPVMKPTTTNSTTGTSAATTSTTFQVITTSFLVVLVTATSSMFFAL